MPHCFPRLRLTHKLANHLFGHLLPKKKGKAKGGVVETFHDHVGKVAYKTYRGELPDGTPVAVRFNLADETIFIGMNDEVE